MRFYLKTCCFCFELHQAFIFTLYLEFARLLWVFLFMIILLCNSSGTAIYDYILEAITLLLAIIQTICAFRCIYLGLKANNHEIHQKYLFSKFFFMISNSISLTFKAQSIFSIENLKDFRIQDEINLSFFTDAIWSIYEIYLLMVIYCFYIRVKRGYYGQRGEIPYFPQQISYSNVGFYKTGIIRETQGYKIKNVVVESVEIGISLNKINFKKPKESMKKKEYLTIYPYTLNKK